MSRQAYNEVATYVDDESGDLRPADQCEVSVFKAGTSELASIYESRSGGTLISNPILTSDNGMVSFYASTGDYDIEFHDTKAPARFGDYKIGWQSSPVDTKIESKDLQDSSTIEWNQDPETGAWIPSFIEGSISVGSKETKLISGVKEIIEAPVNLETSYKSVGIEIPLDLSVESKVQFITSARRSGSGTSSISTSIKIDENSEETPVGFIPSPLDVMGFQIYEKVLKSGDHLILYRAKRSSDGNGSAALASTQTRIMYKVWAA